MGCSGLHRTVGAVLYCGGYGVKGITGGSRGLCGIVGDFRGFGE